MHASNKNLRCGSWLFSQIRQAEGFHLKAYLCPAGVWTIGYGHTGTAIKKGLTIDKAQAEAFLMSDTTRAANIVRLHVDQPMTQAHLEVFVDFTFNFGGGAFQRSTMLRKFNDGDVAGSLAELPKWCYARVNGVDTKEPGLVTRRSAEVKHWLCKGIYNRNFSNK